jgi:hypothetical protein
MEDSFETIVKVIVFLALFVGGIVADIVKKNKNNRETDDMTPQPARQPSGAGVPTQSTAPIPKPAPKKAAVKSKIAPPDNSEWLASVADRERREAAKTAAKAQAKAAELSEPEATDVLTERLRDPASYSALSAQQARDGFIMAEILGPPVSAR